MSAAVGAGVGLAAASGILSVVQGVMQRQAIHAQSRGQMQDNISRLKEFVEDSELEQRTLTETNAGRYARSGLNLSHGSPLFAAVNVANEFDKARTRKRIETERVNEQIRLQAKAGQTSAAVAAGGSVLNAGSRILGILGDN